MKTRNLIMREYAASQLLGTSVFVMGEAKVEQVVEPLS